jgi:hypothetical protein
MMTCVCECDVLPAYAWPTNHVKTFVRKIITKHHFLGITCLLALSQLRSSQYHGLMSVGNASVDNNANGIINVAVLETVPYLWYDGLIITRSPSIATTTTSIIKPTVTNDHLVVIPTLLIINVVLLAISWSLSLSSSYVVNDKE